ncbi:hypothetical protein F2Q68_00032393 [Brassica cretica]|uniref:non-specific serine/threonine protein kinase n=1 Tax=Brassica cretica TaxID=69181 RepID=A0A8S9GDU1_BRACR|nr:hypothetical protein F2Q68_00032393 [Brassica cretica]
MVFKNKLFFSSKKSGSSSPDSSNSPRSVGSKDDNPSSGVGCKQAEIKDGSKKGKGKQVPSPHSIGKSNLSPSSDAKEGGGGPAFVSPIMASSLGLNRIKTRSGPLPRESVFNFRNDGETPPLLSTSKLSKKEAGSIKENTDRDGLSPDTGPVRSLSPKLPPASGSRLQNVASGATADWWSVGIILFELIVGIPPFNAEHPQQIFDNILNRNIPWPHVPEEMSAEAHDIIDRFLTEDPHLRLGARGAAEVKQHSFFKDINWDTLARQKAAFVPASESAIDTSYFRSRYSWNTSDEQFFPSGEVEDYSDADSLSGSSGCSSNRHEEGEVNNFTKMDQNGGTQVEESDGQAEFESGVPADYSFSNFSFKNLSQLASINYDLLSKGWKDEPQPNSRQK